MPLIFVIENEHVVGQKRNKTGTPLNVFANFVPLVIIDSRSGGMTEIYTEENSCFVWKATSGLRRLSLKASFKTRQHVTFPRIFEIKRIPACHCMELYGKINSIAFIPLQIEFVM